MDVMPELFLICRGLFRAGSLHGNGIVKCSPLVHCDPGEALLRRRKCAGIVAIRRKSAVNSSQLPCRIRPVRVGCRRRFGRSGDGRPSHALLGFRRDRRRAMVL